VQQFGKFRLVELLASGGMAEVWRAEMPGAAGFVKEIALKLVRGEHREDDAFTRMFIQEARLASRLDHANIVHVFDLGQVEGRYYIAMELVRGRTLREVVDRCRERGVRFGVTRAVHVCADVARALAYAHRLEVDGRVAGLVHRDVSPQNVLVSLEGEVKLADFGIARAAGADELTSAGTIKGKLAYMAPEQARGEPVDARADVFGLGVVLWELCAGRRLFARDGDAATLGAVLDTKPVSRPSEWNESVPAELDRVVLSALERDRERRTSSAEELAQSLAALRLRLAAASPDELDLRALLRRLWPDGEVRPIPPREPTAVMGAPHVPIAAEPEAGRDGATERGDAAAQPADRSRIATGGDAPPPARAVAPEDAPTQTLAYPRPFSPDRPRRRTAALLALLAFAIGVTVVVLRWAGAGRDGSAAQPDARRVPAESNAGRVNASNARESGSSVSDRPGASPAAPENPQVAAPSSPEPRAVPPPGAGTKAPAGEEIPPPQASTATRDARSAAAAAAPRRTGAKATLVVDVVPWATVYVDGERVGDTPLTLEVPAGAHQVRAVHPRLGSARARLELAPGERLRWAPELSR
jgi:serine/threonine-protein kinase